MQPYPKSLLIRPITFIIIVGFATLSSCNKFKKAKQNVAEKKDALVDKIFPTFDEHIPDTPSNKRRFGEYLEVALTNDVKNIYARSDFGIDYSVLIGFRCDSSTITRIVNTKKMTLCKEFDSGLFFATELPWWDKDKIEKIRPYKIGREREYWKYLWYDADSKTAYYEEFSL